MPVPQAVGEEIFVKLFDGIIKKKKGTSRLDVRMRFFKLFGDYTEGIVVSVRVQRFPRGLRFCGRAPTIVTFVPWRHIEFKKATYYLGVRMGDLDIFVNYRTWRA